ncbi:hypothetical protein [Halorarum halobium]|uniref:hypothetical protein n=1 Tax=Halorarum halobium TaxID=3075121 RepID=UPI0028AA1564|nr:hypothetical protein [Halobaculum sp. XH14]
MREEGVIEERQHLALETVQKFYEEHGYWPTQREAHVFLVEDLDILSKRQRTEAITDGYRFLGRRMGELVDDAENEYPSLLEKQEKREHDYLQEEHPGADSGRKGEPHRIIADVAEKEKQVDDTGSEAEPEQGTEEPDEIEIPYSVGDGDEVCMGPPSEAIKETSDLESVKQLLESKGLLEEYQEELAAQEDDVEESYDDSEEDVEYLLDPDKDPENTDSSDSDQVEDASDDGNGSDSEEKQGKLIYDKGKVVG